MTQKINYLAIIPARKNSKRIKNKNLVKINNKELIKFTIEAAKKVKKIDEIVVTSDDERILKIAKKFKIKAVKRPQKLCGDSNSTEEAILHAYEYITKKELKKINNIILLQPTSPLRTYKHINQCINLFEKKKYSSIFSAYKKKDFIWRKKKNKIKSLSYNFKERKKSQKLDEMIFENGAIYIFQAKGFLNFKNRLFGRVGVYYMEKINSIDIDDINDVNLVKQIIKI